MGVSQKYTIGIPRALLYYKHSVLWQNFFEELGCDIVLSPKTTKKLLDDGIINSIDESCLSAKIFMGHVNYLRGKVDYILVPRIVSYGKNECTCTKFHALYDIVKNTFDDINLLDYNLDIENGSGEFSGFYKMGLNFTKNPMKIYNAYKKAKNSQYLENKKKEAYQDKLLEKSNKLKILVVSHPYNIYDEFIGQPIVKYLKQLDTSPIYADVLDEDTAKQKSKQISSGLYWSYNKELVGAIEHYKDKIDGIIFLVAFPCGPDSLVNELCQRKIKDIPIINIVLDELQGEAGLHTRLESFIDIINMKKKDSEEIVRQERCKYEQ